MQPNDRNRMKCSVANPIKCSIVFISALLCLSTGIAAAQEWSEWRGDSGGVRIRAGLRDHVQNAAKHTAAVEVEVQNVWLNYPNAFVQPGIRVGVLEYEVDECPKIITTETRLRFRDLAPGSHTITISLLGLDDQLLTPQVKLNLSVP
jgi:hypothetical protein